MTEEAYGVVDIDIAGVFSWFVDHCDECSFPGREKLEVTGGEELTKVLKLYQNFINCIFSWCFISIIFKCSCCSVVF